MISKMKNTAANAHSSLSLPRALVLWLVALCFGVFSGPALMAETGQPEKDEWNLLTQLIGQRINWDNDRLSKEVIRQEALILESDTTPVSIVFRRTEALLKHLQGMGVPLKEEQKRLDELKHQKAGDTFDHFTQITTLRRAIAFQNPLLEFKEILFIKHDKMARGARHMVDQYLGFNQKKAGGVYILENPFSLIPEETKVKSLLAGNTVKNGRLKGKLLEDQGAIISLELDYDAKHIYFAFTEAKHEKYELPENESDPLNVLKSYHSASGHAGSFYAFTPERNFQIMRMNADGSELTALTDASHNDFDPCVLPSGRLVFVSDRSEGNQRCGSRYNSTYTLHGMMPDGSDIIPFSYHDTNEWHPSVDNNGMVIYSRWDYVDRDSDIAHHLWHCYPDGRDPRSYHGNYPEIRESRPWMELANRAIPNSHKYISVAAPHHGENYGSLVMIDIRKKDDGSMSQIKRITPEVLFPESESAPGKMHAKGTHRPNGEIYGQPWPLSEDFYLCTYSMPGKKHGIYLVDSFGNKELLYQDEKIGCLDPIPFRARKRPPVIPVKTQQAKMDQLPDQAAGKDAPMGTVSIMNVYASRYPWPKGTQIKELRIINPFPKPNYHLDKPMIGMADQSLARGILGTVPVEADGSVHFECPTGMGIYFQALDERGMMVQNMRSVTYLHPGERLSCVGCHESSHNSPVNRGHTPTALQRPASKIKPEASGSYPLTFPRLVQPVLDRKCVVCHDGQARGGSLRGDTFAQHGWSAAFATLSRHAWGKSGGNGAIRKNKRSYSIPGQEGFRVSNLYKILVQRDHHGVKLTPDELRRISAWVDCNSNFYGAYIETDKQGDGGIVKPLLGLPRDVPFEKLVR
ncbi:MAG: hypothetical protein KJO21_12200 [Verrucomicrobiae bacterium]|nr:hypothetical protein [Verrucomicrobiae bacterium]NNJ43981.1 hypothetical protein [Akkermansiaceae bacterium]